MFRKLNILLLLCTLALTQNVNQVAGIQGEPGQGSDELAEFVASLRASGIDFETDSARVRAARAECQQYRDQAGLLPQPILEVAYPAFWRVQSSLNDLRRAKELPGGISRGRGDVHIANTGQAIVCPQPVDFRHHQYVRLLFEAGTVLVSQHPTNGGSWPTIDATGSECCTIDGCAIVTSSRFVEAVCGIFLGRETWGDDAHFNRISNTQIVGAFGDANPYGGACVINVGAEVFRITDRNSWRFRGRAGEALYCSAYNEHRVSSPYGPIAGGYTPGAGGDVSNAGGVIDGACSFGVDGLPDGADPARRRIVKLGSRTHSVWIRDLYLTAKTPGSLAADFVLGDRGDNDVLYGGTQNITIQNVYDEAYSAPFAVACDGKTRGVSVSNWIVQAGQVLTYRPDVHASRWVDGVTVGNVIHRPHPEYWTGRPEPAQRPPGN